MRKEEPTDWVLPQEVAEGPSEEAGKGLWQDASWGWGSRKAVFPVSLWGTSDLW